MLRLLAGLLRCAILQDAFGLRDFLFRRADLPLASRDHLPYAGQRSDRFVLAGEVEDPVALRLHILQILVISAQEHAQAAGHLVHGFCFPVQQGDFFACFR